MKPAEAKPRRKLSRKKKFLFLGFLYVLFEVGCWIGLLILEATFDIHYVPIGVELNAHQRRNLTAFVAAARKGDTRAHDAVLGWTMVKETNAHGMRDDRDYAVESPEGVLRIAAFGDSFTRGSGVRLSESWGKQLTELNSSIELLNYGVGAYGLDQAYLRYQRLGVKENPHVVFIGYMSENIARNVNRFRGFYTQSYRQSIFSKPRFLVKDGRLALLENPQRTVQDCERFLNDGRTVLRELGEHDYHYRVSAHEGAFDFLPSVRLGKMVAAALNGSVVSPIFDWQGRYVPSSEAYQVTLKIFEAFYRDVLEQGALPVIVIFGDKNDQEDAKRGKPRRYKVLLEAFVERGYMVIDTMEALEAAYDRYSLANLMVDWGHYSVVANSLTARHIAEKIDAWGLSEPEVRARLIHEARQRMGGTPDY